MTGLGPTAAPRAAFDGVAATGAINSPLEQRERWSADELILARVRTAPSSGVAAARSALA